MRVAIGIYQVYRRAGNSIATSIKAGLAAWRKADLLPLVTAINLIHGRPMLSKQDAQRVLKISGVTA